MFRNYVGCRNIEFACCVSAVLFIYTLSTRADTPAQTIFSAVADRIVTITTLSVGGSSIGQGSGVILGPSLRSLDPANPGYADFSKGIDILTNFHVVKTAKVIVVHTRAGKTFNAGLLYFDQTQDLALLRIPFELKIDEMPLAPSVAIGETAYAVGTPEGLGWSISNGIVSGQRTTSDQSEAIQTTAPISPGSSGGGLFNEKGELIGVTSFVLTEGQNLNFARRISPKFALYLSKFRGRLMAYPWQDVSFGGERSAVLEQDWELGHFEAYDRADSDPARWRHSNPTFARFVAEGSAYEKFVSSYSQEYEKLDINDPRYLRYKRMLNKHELTLYNTIPEPRFFAAYFESITDSNQQFKVLQDALEKWPENRDIALEAFSVFYRLPDNYQSALQLVSLQARRLVPLTRIREQVVHPEDPSSEIAFRQLRFLEINPYREELQREVVSLGASLEISGTNNVRATELRKFIISKSDLP